MVSLLLLQGLGVNLAAVICQEDGLKHYTVGDDRQLTNGVGGVDLGLLVPALVGRGRWGWSLRGAAVSALLPQRVEAPFGRGRAAAAIFVLAHLHAGQDESGGHGVGPAGLDVSQRHDLNQPNSKSRLNEQDEGDTMGPESSAISTAADGARLAQASLCLSRL